jgi:pimeloyl-ACP methyl ester carboxylesterase
VPPAPPVRYLTTADGVDIAVHVIGDPAGPPVILAPGTFSNSSFWLGTRGTGFARYLADRGFEAWVIDFRGHGLSQRPAPGQDWNFDDWGRFDVTAVIEAALEEGRTPLLVGHSAGGASMLAALAGTPALVDAVAGAAIIATPLPWLQRWRRSFGWSRRGSPSRTIRSSARASTSWPAT